ncbi:MAG TPA: hypothetical protein VFR61_08625 [Nitrososphaeraceae archaeon]|jgi:hypothetical protein|nr:hypothetical protein [Nitrososphaeraceae archaeon]
MESLKQEASKAINENKDKDSERNISNWSDVVGDIVDKLTGKDMEVTYDFDNLEVDIPKATGPQGKELGSAKWKINGKFIISTQLHDNTKTME